MCRGRSTEPHLEVLPRVEREEGLQDHWEGGGGGRGGGGGEEEGGGGRREVGREGEEGEGGWQSRWRGGGGRGAKRVLTRAGAPQSD